MSDLKLDNKYWDNRYTQNDFPWDVGFASPSIIDYFSTLENKELKILFPGAGNGREAAEIYKMGFLNVHILDYAPTPIQNFINANPSFPSTQIYCVDFFSHNNKYDLIVEQTFFCALNPELREKYVKKMVDLLNNEGKLVGLMFGVPMNPDKPPFGGNENEYRSLFEKKFNITTMKPCENSVPRRAGSELWVEMSLCEK